MIAEYTMEQADEVAALPGPKHVWIDGKVIRVYTGADIPPPPAPAVVMVEESVALAAIKAAGKSDSEAKALLSAEAAKG